MNARLEHRGPDSAGFLIDQGTGLAMRRLSIIDLEGGDQPILNEDETVAVVANGEIYNYRELGEELRHQGHRFRTGSDIEVIAHLYEQHGLGFADRLRGMFAVALWDKRRRRLVLARDRFGIKPLYYGTAGGDFVFASELKSLLALPGFSEEIDLSGLEAYVARGFVPGPLTIYRDARKLQAGHTLIHEAGQITLRRYARPSPRRADALRQEPFAVLAEELRSRLRDSVRAHLVADVPVGVLLSGGVDSSIITALAAEESAGVINTFSVGFDDASYDELSRARLVAERYGTNHHEIVVTATAIDALAKVVATFDEPFADTSALPTYLVSELAGSHVKVALAGEGGDELFGGYHTYVADNLAPRLGPLASAAGPLLDRLPSSSHALRLDDKAKRFARGARLGPMARHCSWQDVFSADARAELMPLHKRGADPLDLYRARYAETVGAEPLARFQDLDLGVYLVDQLLVKSDRCSMARSLELRVPFLDTEVADLALALPSRYKVHGLAKKRLLRAAAAPLVPKEILQARKQGFSAPTASWFRRELEGFVRDTLSPSELARDGYFAPAFVAELIDAHTSRRADNSRQIWALLTFKLWLEGSAPRPDGEAPRASRAWAGRGDSIRSGSPPPS